MRHSTEVLFAALIRDYWPERSVFLQWEAFLNSQMSLWICPECFVPLPLSPPTEAADGGDAQGFVALMQMVHL